MTDYNQLLLDAYSGELFGNAIFGEMAGRDEWCEHRATLETLAAIEQRTADTLRPLVDAAGIDVDEEKPRREGRELGAISSGWDDFVKALFEALPPFLANFVRLRELAADPHDPAFAALVAHEQTIGAFAQLELAGHRDISATLLTRYLETAP